MSAAPISTGSLASELWNACAFPLKCADHGVRHADLPRGFGNGVDRLAKCDTGGEVK
jgi:hypothetical protein